MVIAGLVGAGMAILLGASYGLVTFGLFGYNSILTGMAFWSGPFTKTNKATFWLSIYGAAITAVVWMALWHVMGDMFSICVGPKDWHLHLKTLRLRPALQINGPFRASHPHSSSRLGL